MTRRSLFARLLALAAVPFVGKPKPLQFRSWMCGPPRLTQELLDDCVISRNQFDCFRLGIYPTLNEIRAIRGRPPFKPAGDDPLGEPVPA